MIPPLVFIYLLHACCCVWAPPSSAPPSVVFSRGTLLLVGEAEHLHHQRGTPDAGSAASVHIQLFSSVLLEQSPEVPQVLVCIITGLKSAHQDVLWWVNDTLLKPSDTRAMWALSETGPYSATAVWQLPAAQWSPTATYWCGTVQGDQVIRQKGCWTHGESDNE
ncbi:hypothetical protein D4764_07G0010830 [Takifugu flavidus]|uniref:Ig-like domain-containing protein n=1 Tax=Takifugu flavidus TaxID=433684 RepID=A0A5C6MST8_9TELE|nr:hypothetical protein D4764_07G0010830 [Takifugu flavidus]